MNRAMTIISDIPSNKEGIKIFANAIVDAVMNGDSDPLEVRAKIDAIEKIIKAVKDDVAFRDAVLDRADLEPDKTFDFQGVKFTKAESARYDYSDDKVWSDYKNEEDEIAAYRKEREEMLKALKEPTEINGVLCYPPAKKSTTYVRVTF
jgi:hypothetical protein